MKSWFRFCATVMSILEVIFGQDIHAEESMRRESRNRCSREYGSWKLMSITFHPHESKVTNEEEVLRQVTMVQKRHSPQSTAEIIINHSFNGYSRYNHLNGTKIKPYIPDAGRVPMTINGKVTNVMQFNTNGVLYGKTNATDVIQTNFKCNSKENQEIACKVILKTKRYQVPFTAFVRHGKESYICLSEGTWEKHGDPVLEFITMVK